MKLTTPAAPTIDVYLVKSDSAGYLEETGGRTTDKKQAREFATFSQALAASERSDDRVYRRKKPIPVSA